MVRDGFSFAHRCIMEMAARPLTLLVLPTRIHDRMPVILRPEDYARWLSDKADPRDLMKPSPADLMRMWPNGRKVGRYENNTPDILDLWSPKTPRSLRPVRRSLSPRRRMIRRGHCFDDGAARGGLNGGRAYRAASNAK